MIWFIFALFLFAPMGLQRLVLSRTERRFRALRWALLLLPVLLARQGHWYLHAPWEEYPHPDGLAGTLFYICAALALAGWGMGWALYKFQKWRENREKDPPL